MSIDDYYVYVRKQMFVLLSAPNPTNAPVPVPLVIDSDTEAACDDDVSATGASFLSCRSGNASLDETPTNNSTTDRTIGSDLNCDDENDDEAEEIDNGGDVMPDEWYFPCYIAFALLGPIVPPAIVQHRSELFMTGQPPTALGDTSDGCAALWRMEKGKKKQLLQGQH